MRSKISSFLIFSYLAISHFIFAAEASRIEMTVHNVGQGNLVSLNFDGTHMIVDAGSFSHKQEWKYLQGVPKKPQNPLLSPKKFSSPSKVPVSAKKPSNFRDVVKKQGEEAQKTTEEVILEIRQTLPQINLPENQNDALVEPPRKKRKLNEGEEEETAVHIKTFVVTHPDTDHYNWTARLFSSKNDHIENIIFCGLPLHYDLKGTMGLRDWLSQRKANGSKIYFPAIQHTAVEDLDELFNKKTFASYKHYAPQNPPLFGDAFDFGEAFKVLPLAVNPTHFKSEKGTIRTSDPKDDNSDSLILKVSCGASSALLTGDATGLTTNRLLKSLKDRSDILESNIFLASHHGSTVKDCNALNFVQKVNPEYVLISNGRSKHHPHLEAYEAFKKSDRLKKVGWHRVIVGKSLETKTGEIIHKTHNAIFSTLSSGKISATLTETGVNLSTEQNGPIRSVLKPSEVLQEDDDLK